MSQVWKRHRQDPGGGTGNAPVPALPAPFPGEGKHTDSIVLEYASEEAARADIDRIWAKDKVSGEVVLKKAGEGHWFLEITSEKDLTQAVLEKMKGRRL